MNRSKSYFLTVKLVNLTTSVKMIHKIFGVGNNLNAHHLKIVKVTKLFFFMLCDNVDDKMCINFYVSQSNRSSVINIVVKVSKRQIVTNEAEFEKKVFL